MSSAAEIGTKNQDFHAFPAGAFEGPHWKNNFDVYCILPDGVNDKVRAWRSRDSGGFFAELDSANAPSATDIGSTTGVGVDRIGDVLHVLIPHDTNATGGSPDDREDIEWRYYTFSLTTNTWSSLISTTDFTTANEASSGDLFGPACFRVRSDGDLVLAYTVAGAAGHWDRTFFATFNGSTWTSGITAGEGDSDITTPDLPVDNSTLPVAMIRGASDRMHLMIWSPQGGDSQDDFVHMVSIDSSDVVGTLQTDVLDLDLTSLGYINTWPAGQPAYDSSSDTLAFPVAHTLTNSPLAIVGLKVIRAASGAAPSWSVDQLISIAQAQADAFNIPVVNQGGQGAAVFVNGQLFVVWTGTTNVHFSTRESGVWTAPAKLAASGVPRAQSSGAIANNLSVTALEDSGQGISILGRSTQGGNGFAWHATYAVPENEDAAVSSAGVSY